jgi:hypothetical protein
MVIDWYIFWFLLGEHLGEELVCKWAWLPMQLLQNLLRVLLVSLLVSAWAGVSVFIFSCSEGCVVLFFFFLIFFCGLGPTPWATPPAPFSDGLFFFFWDRVSWTICVGWLWTVILLISASWVSRIQSWATGAWLFGSLCGFNSHFSDDGPELIVCRSSWSNKVLIEEWKLC